MKATAKLEQMGERIDRLVTVDVGDRGVIETLYAAARGRGKSLCLAAAQALRRRVRPGSSVFIATGWHDRPQINSQVAESDGPLGAVVLARTLHAVCGAVPLLLVENRLVPVLETMLRAVGLVPLAAEETQASRSFAAELHGAAVIRFSKNREEARTHGEQLLAAFQPRALIAVEVGGMNREGGIFTFRGDEATQHAPKFDLLFAAAAARRTLTIGIGDGGNELGFGNIRRAVRREIPDTRQPAGVIAPATKVDHLVPAAVSNWGAYGVAACLCRLAQMPQHLHTPQMEARLLEAAARAGLIDGMSGYVEPTADGLGGEVHAGLVALLQAVARSSGPSG